MIKIVCAKCKEESNPVGDPQEDKAGYLEINLNDNVWYYKCPHCLKTNKFVIKQESQPLPRIRGM